VNTEPELFAWAVLSREDKTTIHRTREKARREKRRRFFKARVAKVKIKINFVEFD
jgi:hypothetical protein